MICRIALWHDEPSFKELSYMQRLNIVLENILAIRQIEKRPVIIESKVDSDVDVSDCDY
jgi:hypothetical protein